MSPATSRKQFTDDQTHLDSAPPTVGFLIDEQGREIAITEQMIQQACADLDRQWRPAQAASR